MTTPDAAPSAREASRPWSLGEKLAWLLIVLAVVAVLVTHFALNRARLATPATPNRPAVPLLVSARYLVGARNAIPIRAEFRDAAKTLQDSAKSLDSAANSPMGKLEVAIVRGELESARTRDGALENLKRDHPEIRGEVELLQDVLSEEVPADDPQWQALHRRLGWFGDLALAQGKPADDPIRTRAMNAAYRTVGTILAFISVAALAGIAGLVLGILGLVLFAQGRLQRGFAHSSLPAQRGPCVEAFAVYLALMVGIGLAILHLPLGKQIGMAGRVATMAVPFAAALIWPLIRGQTLQQWRQALGLHAGKGLLREVFAGIAGYCAGIPLIAVGIITTMFLARTTGAETTHPIVQEVTAGTPRVLLWLFLASVWAPISEELMFRGLLFAHLRERFGFWISAIGVAFVFAIIHPQGWAAVPALGAIAVVFAAIREWRGSIIGPILGHALNNTAVMLMLLGATS